VRVRVGALTEELRAFRRDLHAHPELSRAEHRTTERLAQRLQDAGLEVDPLEGTGLTCDVPTRAGTRARGLLALRADLDALPVGEDSGLAFSSTVPGVAHACGHDLHTTIVLGAGLVLAELAAQGRTDYDVRLIFQPSEEIQPGGAVDMMRAGRLEGVNQIFALHCEPKLDVGQVGTRIGPITSTADAVTVTLTSEGGHTSRPHLTGDLVTALGYVITAVPALLNRRIDPRSGVNLTWGAVHAGSTPNAIPTLGTLTGTLRCLDARAWESAQRMLREVVEHVIGPTGVNAEVTIVPGVPPVDNDEGSVRLLDEAVRSVLGPQALQLTDQSLVGRTSAGT